MPAAAIKLPSVERANFDAPTQIIRALVVDKTPARVLAARLNVTEAQLAAHTMQILQGWIAEVAEATNGWADLSATVDGLQEVLETGKA